MKERDQERLYNLLPVIYRQLDIEQGEPLRAFMDVIESEYRALEEDIGGLYDNWFIETCDEWVVPYIADMLGVRGAADGKVYAAALRGRVADTVANRRRKGVASALERAAQDATGWKAHAVEFFKLLAVTQSLRDPRANRGRTADLRDLRAAGAVGTPFDSLARNVDVHSLRAGPAGSAGGADARDAASTQGRYNVGHVGLFLWRLQSYRVTHGTPKQLQPLCYSFHPLGDGWQPAGVELFTLFNQPLTEQSAAQPSRERNVPAALRRGPLADELDALRRGAAPPSNYFGAQPVLEVFTKTDTSPPLFESIPPENMVVRDLRRCRGRLLFVMGPEFAGLLDAGGKLHYDVRREFKTRRVWLTQETRVVVQERGRQWLVVERLRGDRGETRQRGYFVAREGEGIGVYDQSLFVLFSMGLEDEGALKRDEVRGEVRRQFAEHDIFLPARAKVSKPEPGRWLIEGGGGRRYLVVREERRLDVYDPTVRVAVDPALGRLAFPSYVAPEDVRVSYSYGFSADTGGGPYERRHTLTAAGPDSWRALVSIDNPVVPLRKDVKPYRALRDALRDWAKSGRDGLIQIGDNGIYELGATDESGAVNGLERVVLTDGRSLVIEAADGVAPCVNGGLHLTGEGRGGNVKLSGLLMEGVLLVEGSLALEILHCTIKPRARGLATEVNPPARVEGPDSSGLMLTIERSIVGRVSLPDQARGLAISDSVVDGGGGAAVSGVTVVAVGCVVTSPDVACEFGPPTSVERSTIFGPVSVKELTASDSVFDGRVKVQNRQAGSVRYSYVPRESETPPRYRCQPDTALGETSDAAARAAAAAEVRPSFTSEVYGHPGYAQLGPLCPREIRVGAEDGSEMGAFGRLYQPQRRAEVESALAEYLPFGQEGGVFFVN